MYIERNALIRRLPGISLVNTSRFRYADANVEATTATVRACPDRMSLRAMSAMYTAPPQPLSFEIANAKRSSWAAAQRAVLPKREWPCTATRWPSISG